MKRETQKWTVVVWVLLFLVGPGRAQVNQYLGFPDEAFDYGDIEGSNCDCHGGPDDNVVRHHALDGTGPIDASSVPLPDSDGVGGTDSGYACLNCHGDSFSVNRTCTDCHGSSGTPHHMGSDAQTGKCAACHSYVTNHTSSPSRPSYPISDIAPVPGGSAKGACEYCHRSGGAILSNHELHHDTGLHDGADTHCDTCHISGFGGGSGDPDNTTAEMLACEGCHSMSKLHNTQADSASPHDSPVNVGKVDAGYGHVGRDQRGGGESDCLGCHGGASGLGLTSTTDALIPTLYSSNRKTVLAGTETMIVLHGAVLVNAVGEVLFEAEGVLTASDGASVILKPLVIDAGMMVVSIPGDVAPGLYKLRAVKYRPPAEGTDGPGEPVPSNPVAITVVPQVRISDVSIADEVVTIQGSGFAGHQEGSGTSVSGQVGTAFVEASIVSWSATCIKADFGGAKPEAVTVHSIYGSDTWSARRDAILGKR